MALVNDRDFPGAVAANASYELFNPLDLYQTEIYQKSVKTVPYMSSLSWLKNLEGRSTKRKVKRSEYSFYEEGQFMKAACTIAAVATSGAKLLITLSTGDHSDIGGTNETSFVVKNQTCMFSDGKTTGFVESVDRSAPGAHVVTVKKFNPNQDIATAAVVGTSIVFWGNAQSARSGQTESRVDAYEKITNKMQIVRESFNTDDVETQNIRWFKDAETGKQYMYYDGIDKTSQRFEFQKEAALLVAPQADQLTDLAGNTINSAYGLVPQIDDHGINMEYSGQPDGATFDEMIAALDNNYGDSIYMVGHGMNLMLKLKDYLVAFGQNGTGNINFSPFQGGSEQAINLNFKSYSVGAYSFHFNQWSIFSHKDSLGAPGLPYRYMALFIPGGLTKNANPARGENEAAYEPYMQMTSPVWGVPNPNIDKGEYLMWETGAMGANGPTSDILEKIVHFVAYLGLEIRCRHKFGKWEIA